MLTPSYFKKISKFLSFILRHKPQYIDIVLDEQGWANIDELIKKANQSREFITLDRSLIKLVVESNDKKRFTISEDSQRIRANQGHSININLQLRPLIPPEFLFHGTATRFLENILQEGLKSQERQYVHLSKDAEIAKSVGQRHGKAVILEIKALLMHKQSCKFYLAENGVWLTKKIDPIYFFRYSPQKNLFQQNNI